MASVNIGGGANTLNVGLARLVTFGPSTGTATFQEFAGTINATRLQNTAGTGKLVKVELLIADTTPNGLVRMGVYSDVAGGPSQLLGDAGQVAVINGLVAIGGIRIPVVLNAWYWLGFLLSVQNGVRYYAGAAGSHWFTSTGIPFGPLPNPAPAPDVYSPGADPYVMRATVAVGAQ